MNITRVYLRTPTQDEVTGYVRHLWSDEASMKDVGGTHSLDDEKAKRWYAAWIDPGNADRQYFLIIRQADELPIGETSFHDFNPETGIAKYSMNVEAKYRGQGYAREALELLLRKYFEELGGTTIVDDIALENTRAQSIFLKFGFEHDPSLATTLRSVDGDAVFWVRMDKGKFVQLYG